MDNKADNVVDSNVDELLGEPMAQAVALLVKMVDEGGRIQRNLIVKEALMFSSTAYSDHVDYLDDNLVRWMVGAGMLQRYFIFDCLQFFRVSEGGKGMIRHMREAREMPAYRREMAQ